MAVGKLLIRPFIVAVDGYDQTTYFTASRGKALAAAWRSYSSLFDVTFKDFLRRANAYGGIGSPRFGEQIVVCGKPAFWVACNSQYIRFVRPDSDVILNSHPFDVEPPAARRGTAYYEPPEERSHGAL